jgi:hypothetical protein
VIKGVERQTKSKDKILTMKKKALQREVVSIRVKNSEAPLR